MKILVQWLFISSLLVLIICEVTFRASAKSGGLVIEGGPIYNAGDVYINSTLDLDLIVSNLSSASIQILDAKPSCSCVGVKLESFALAPHQKGRMHLNINVEPPIGPHSVSVALQWKTLTETTINTEVVEIALTSVRSFVADPPVLDFGEVRPGETKTLRVKFDRGNALDADWDKLLLVSSNSNFIVDPTMVGEGENALIRLCAPPGPGGLLKGALNVKVIKAGKSIGIRDSISLLSRIDVGVSSDPSTIFLSSTLPGRPYMGQITISRASGKLMPNQVSLSHANTNFHIEYVNIHGTVADVSYSFVPPIGKKTYSQDIIFDIKGNPEEQLRVPLIGSNRGDPY
jgi:hypothetical protein